MTRIRKQLVVPGMDGDEWFGRIRCGWDDCGNPASYLNRVKVCFAGPRFRHDRSRMCDHCTWYTFCSAQHLDYWKHSHIPGQYGRLSAGVNGIWL